MRQLPHNDVSPPSPLHSYPYTILHISLVMTLTRNLDQVWARKTKYCVHSTSLKVHRLFFLYVGVGPAVLTDTHCDAPPPSPLHSSPYTILHISLVVTFTRDLDQVWARKTRYCVHSTSLKVHRLFFLYVGVGPAVLTDTQSCWRRNFAGL